MQKNILIIMLLVSINKMLAQNIEYRYDGANRLTDVIYPNRYKVNYAYDNDGNRTRQVTANITSIKEPNDVLKEENVFVYPNPSNGDFNGKVFCSERQEITIEVFNSSGQQIYQYKSEVDNGFYEFNINIQPLMVGTYILNVKGKTLNTSKKVIIVN